MSREFSFGGMERFLEMNYETCCIKGVNMLECWTIHLIMLKVVSFTWLVFYDNVFKCQYGWGAHEAGFFWSFRMVFKSGPGGRRGEAWWEGRFPPEVRCCLIWLGWTGRQSVHDMLLPLFYFSHSGGLVLWPQNEPGALGRECRVVIHWTLRESPTSFFNNSMSAIS